VYELAAGVGVGMGTSHGSRGQQAEIGFRVIGQPFDWPTRGEMRALFERAGFRVEAQRRVYRVPAGLLLRPVMTIGVRPG